MTPSSAMLALALLSFASACGVPDDPQVAPDASVPSDGGLADTLGAADVRPDTGGEPALSCLAFGAGEATLGESAPAIEPGPNHALHCGRVVWATPKGGLRLFDAQSGSTSTLIPDAAGPDDAAFVRWPDIHQTTVVFSSGGAGATGAGVPQVHVFDLTNGTEAVVDPAGGAQLRPRISADRIVWEDERDGVARIRVLDRTSAAAVWADATGTAEQRFPAVSFARVVWTDFREDPDRAFSGDGKDLADIHGVGTAGAQALVTAARLQAFADVDGERVVWLDWRNQPHDAAGRPQPSNGQDFEVWSGTFEGVELQGERLAGVSGGSYAGLPTVAGGWVAWVGGGQVLGAYLDGSPDVVGLSAGAPAATTPVLSPTHLLFRSAIGLTLKPLGDAN